MESRDQSHHPAITVANRHYRKQFQPEIAYGNAISQQLSFLHSGVESVVCRIPMVMRLADALARFALSRIPEAVSILGRRCAFALLLHSDFLSAQSFRRAYVFACLG
jgi:hypothetical protein